MDLSKTIKVVLLFLLCGFISAEAIAQPNERNLYDFEYIKGSNGWLTSSNASGLCVLPISNVATIQASYYQGIGEFVNFYQSDNRYNINANTESFFRIGEKVALYGKISYDYFRGKNMGGSSFSDPYFTSFDIVEVADTNRGVKQKDYYHLIGGIGFDVTKKFRLGAKIDYASGNYAKFKDLRHTNYLLDMNLSAGASYRIANFLEIGLNYLHKRNVESIKFELFGTADKMYNTLISYGAFYGSSELFGETGYTKERNPHVSSFHGGAMQLNLIFSPSVQFFNEVEFLLRNGFYGLLSNSKILYCEHTGTQFNYSGLVSIDGDKSKHTVSLGMSYDLMKNNENLYLSNTIDGLTKIEYIGQNPVTSRKVLTGRAEYTANLNLNGYTPEWVLKGGADLYYRKTNSSVYPFYRKQNITCLTGHLSGNKNFFRTNSIYGVRLMAEYGMGSGTAKEDGLYATPSEDQKQPRSLDDKFYLEFEYFTAPRINANIGFRYSRFFKKGVTGYADLDYKLTNAFGLEYYKKGMFNAITLSVGCTF